jgi:hypothetical protein
MSTSKSTLLVAALAAGLAGCAGGAQLPSSQPGGQAGTQSAHSMAMARSASLRGPFARANLNALAATRRPIVQGAPGVFTATSKAMKPSTSWVIASSEYGELDVYDAVNSALLASCEYCGGWGASVNKKNGDLAVGTTFSTVAVFAKSTPPYFSQYATLSLSSTSGWDPIGLAYDAKGGLYVGNLLSNEIDYFSASTIASGGGSADLKLYPPDLYQVFYLATDGDTLIADGVQPNTDNFVTISVKSTRTGAKDTILQSQSSHYWFPGGLAVDKQHNLTINNQFGTTSTFAKPWTGNATTTLDWYNGSSDFTGIALGKSQQSMYWASTQETGSSVESNWFNGTYPLSQLTFQTLPIANQIYIGIAVDPAAS